MTNMTIEAPVNEELKAEFAQAYNAKTQEAGIPDLRDKIHEFSLAINEILRQHMLFAENWKMRMAVLVAADHTSDDLSTLQSDFSLFEDSLKEKLNYDSILRELVMEAHAEIRKLFPKNELWLTQIHSPEEPAECTMLSIIESDDNAIETAYKNWIEFEKNWWLNNTNRAGGQLVIRLHG